MKRVSGSVTTHMLMVGMLTAWRSRNAETKFVTCDNTCRVGYLMGMQAK